jgi:TrmH family RNA methyltransferase
LHSGEDFGYVWPWEYFDSVTQEHSGLSAVPRALKWYKQLATVKGRRETGLFVVEGHRSLAQIMRQHPEAIEEILTTERPVSAYHQYPVRVLTPAQMRTVCNTRTPQGVMAVVRFPVELYSQQLPSEPGSRVLLIEDVQDPGNVGTLIRTAAGFGFSGVIMTDKGADALAPKCVQATAGTVLSVWIRRTAQYLELVQLLRERGFVCAVTDAHGRTRPERLAAMPRLLLAVGNEAAGISPALRYLADVCVGIPLGANVESLNVAISGAICMYHCAENAGEA